MSHPYPPHHPNLPYTGKHRYFLTFCTADRRRVFEDAAVVRLVETQILRAAARWKFAIPAYCFMPDHLHMLVAAEGAESNCLAFVKAAKQYSGYYFTRAHGGRLWQRYGFERVMRDDAEMALTIGYIVSNPVRAGLASHPSDYPYIGSTIYTVAELLAICEYERRCADLS